MILIIGKMLNFKPVIGPSLDVSTCGCVAPVNKNEKKNKIDGHRIIKYLMSPWLYRNMQMKCETFFFFLNLL